LFVGGSGFTSAAVSRQAIAKGFDLYLLNRGLRLAHLPGSHGLTADIHNLEDVHAVLRDLEFDVVVDWIAYAPYDIERDLALFRGRAKQYVFISSASAYQKPPALSSPSRRRYATYSAYSRNKITCEERLMQAYREEGFPVTIVRPSLTYDPDFPIAIGRWGCYTLVDRLIKGMRWPIHS
jgi:nucleoside-diphosphate-sugar epimerase